MSPQADISTWPNIDQVAARTGISRRTLERELAAGKWQVRKRNRPGVRPETVFDPDQVASRMPAPRSSVVSASTIAVAESQEPVSVESIAEIVSMVCERFMGVMMPPQIAAEPQTLFVGLEEASAITGLSVACLRNLVKEGRIGHVLDWSKTRHKVPKIRRAHLESFELSD